MPVEGKINKKDFFKDFAHIWVGVLIGVSLVYGVVLDEWTWFILPVALTVLEVIAFFVRKP